MLNKKFLFSVVISNLIFIFFIFNTSVSQEISKSDIEFDKISLDSFTIEVPKSWKKFSSNEFKIIEHEYLNQSNQIYQHYTGTNDPTNTVDLAAFHITEISGTFFIVSFTVPPESNLIELLKNQVGEKMKYGIQEGFISKYLGLVSVDENQLSGFITKTISKSGNLDISGGIEHKKLKNTLIQLTLLSPKGWTEDEALSSLMTILKSVTIK